MNVNQERRLARRQTRGLRRVEDILHAAGEIFTEHGYDHATAQMIAQRADVSAGSLYQFFPNKEAIAQALAAQAVERLQHLYDEAILVPDVMALPLPHFLDHLIEALVTFNRNNSGYFALLQGSTVSPQLARAMQEQRQGVTARLVRVVQHLAPGCSSEQCEVLALVTYRVFLALLPLILHADDQQSRTFIEELKALLLRYFEPMQQRERPPDEAR
jgi:AcrR family transcriptional regulator